MSIRTTELPGVPLLARGKVRDIYDLQDALLLVATDRLSAFDYVLPDPIPDKGKVLNQISLFWFERFAARVRHHVLSADVTEFPAPLRAHAALLAGRSMLVGKLRMLPVECVARGYLAGSGWKEYRERGTVCGIGLPPGLSESAQLPEPIFTPATKAQDGHDENIPFSEVERTVGGELAARLRDKTLELYRAGADYARGRGILIADTKFEFGLDGTELVLADEVLTPDSSRFWPAEEYAPGRPQPSYDKQYVRDYLESIGWNKQPPVPALPADIVSGTRARYLEIFQILTGRTLA
ncbi:MAG TPA: phosphoribosylaminoimidazolesuccinocarboxamide synthase [Candidatus Polarisedimenticolaceae bacterium]|nr:phosphoribosylaminoimidazolesuccinocarboxamide synthase [Candidatus Polarisedimenticolaceae bacterium]